MAHQVDLFWVPKLADTEYFEADHNGGGYARSPLTLPVTFRDVHAVTDSLRLRGDPPSVSAG